MVPTSPTPARELGNGRWEVSELKMSEMGTTGYITQSRASNFTCWISVALSDRATGPPIIS